MTYREAVENASGRADLGAGLVGVIVALVLLSVGVLSVSNVLTQSVVMQTITSQRTSAISIARTTMETIRGMDPSTVVAMPATAVDEAGVPDAFGDFVRQVKVGTAGTNLIEVTVEVTIPRSPPVRLVTWIYDAS